MPKSSKGGNTSTLSPGNQTGTRTATKMGSAAKKKASKIHRDLEDKHALAGMTQWRVSNLPSRVSGRQANETGYTWPSVYESPPTFEDQVRSLKLAHIAQGIKPFGQEHASDKDWEWAAKKLQLRKALEYDKLFVQMWDMTSPLEVAEARRIYPEFFENRKKIIRIIAEMQTQLANIMLTGYRDKRDVDFLIELRMLNTPKDDNGIPKFLSIPVYKLNTEEAMAALMSATDIQGGVDVSQLLSKTNTDAPAPHRTVSGFKIDYGNTTQSRTVSGMSYFSPFWTVTMRNDDGTKVQPGNTDIRFGHPTAGLVSLVGGDQRNPIPVRIQNPVAAQGGAGGGVANLGTFQV